MKKLVFIFCLFLLTDLSAQSVDRQLIGSAGGSFSTANINLSFSVGEAVIGTFTEGSIIISQGFQQAEAGASGGGVGTVELLLNNDFSAYPNPVKNNLFLDFTSIGSDLDLNIMVYDLNGNLVFEQSAQVYKDVGGTVKLNMDRLSAGAYIVRLKDKSGSESRFSVVKVE